MSRRAATATGCRPWTVTAMTSRPAIIRYLQLLDALRDRFEEEETALLLLCATSLVRPWELLDPRTELRSGVLHIEASVCNGLRMPARERPLPASLAHGLGDTTGTVYDLLGLPATRPGALLELHRRAARELEVDFDANLEQLAVIHLEALFASATAEHQIQAILAAAGIPDTSKRAHVLRSGGLAAETAWITETTDRFLTAGTAELAQAR